jgi:fatty-acyl-CoA synthase
VGGPGRGRFMQSREAIETALGRRLLLGELVARNARKFPDREAVVYGNTRLTYREFNARVNRLAHALMDMGIKKGEKVAILLFNCSQYLEAYIALAKMGAIAVPLNFRLHPEELTYIINNSDAVALILGEAFVGTVRGIQKDLPQVRQYVSVTEKPVEGMLHFESLLQKYPDDEPLVLLEDDDPAFIMYTAGTTGRPKGAVITHKNQVTMWTLVSLEVSREPDIGGMVEWRACAAPPIFHLASFGMCLAYLLLGATVVLTTEVFNPVEIMQTLEREKCDSVLLIPAMGNFLLQLPDLDKYDTSSLKAWFSGAAILPTELRKRIMKAFPHAKVFDCFGQTESSALVAILRPADAARKAASVGGGGSRLSRPQHHEGILQRPAGERQRLQGRLVPLRRPSAAGRGRLLLCCRPPEGHDRQRRGEYLPGGGRRGPLQAPQDPGGGSHRRPR